ncbi:MAG: hypothetical protein ACT4PJ_18310 [Gemmatimonadaceae bacterium]
MRDYAIFGGSLRSSLDFPSLAAHDSARPTWSLDVRAPEALPDAAAALGEDRVDGTTAVRLYRSHSEWHLVYDDTGRFDIALDGRRIVWRQAPGASPDAARLDVIGRVLAMAMHAGGDVCLHASAVAINGVAIGFLGPKGFGKSTLAWALVRAGARLLTDDTLRVRLGDTSRAYPGVHELRLRSDAAAELPPRARDARASGDRVVVGEFEPDRLQHTPVNLAALYVLAPVKTGVSASGASGVPLAPVPSALALVRHVKIAPLLTGAEAGHLLDRVVALARAVPVRLLEVPRDFGRLDEVVSDLLAWHDAPAEAPAS